MAKKVFTEQEVRDIVTSRVEGVTVPEVEFPEEGLILVTLYGDVTSRELAVLGERFGDEAICVSGDGFSQLMLVIRPTVFDQEG